ncbi:hypothetical protein D9619_000136 [Psilocybe cf. subviscida]|uniref:3-phytase n=1 Tax=Psilocybe cf. subviscida TaxID=2480587 RepID=A0A8H5BEM9_9AGAR|nr:hypothetical protein D9619_000136 [Psilocybe cf. subviscida]
MGSAHSKYPSHGVLVYDATNSDLESAPLLETPTQRPLAAPGSKVPLDVLDAGGSSPPHVQLHPAPRDFKSQEAATEKHAAHVELTGWKETQNIARQVCAGGAVYKGRYGYAHSRRFSYAIVLSGAAMVFSFLILCVFLATGGLPTCLGAGPAPGPPPSGPLKPTKVKTIFAPEETQNNWGAYTPWHPVEKYPSPPPHCKLEQVNILQRHGARYPTSGATTRFKAVVAKLASAASFDPELAFLAKYKYTLGKDDLIPFGAFQSEESGKDAFARYKHLISKKNIPFVRASSSQRVVDSATNWTAGFSSESHKKFKPTLSVILSESANDTLDDAMCPSAGSSDAATGAWAAIFGTPIAARLNSLAPGANLTAADIPNFMPLCAFETLVKEKLSPFCSLFPAAEWAQFEYWTDLDKYYGTGYGQALGPVQGVGYVNELIARLTGQPVQDQTQTNRTLDADPKTFPLDRTMYADFSHDNQMAAIYAALGLFRQPMELNIDHVTKERTWITSSLTPFSSRMVTERFTCHTIRGGKDKFVRILVNDALQPLEFCGGDKDGLCTLNAFVQSQGYARDNGVGDFEKCFA